MDKYMYRLFLDTPSHTPELDLTATRIENISDTYRIYTFDLKPVAGGEIINRAIKYVQNTCKNYKMILVGYHPGHMEIDESDYSGNLSVTINGIDLWPCITKVT